MPLYSNPNLFLPLCSVCILVMGAIIALLESPRMYWQIHQYGKKLSVTERRKGVTYDDLYRAVKAIDKRLFNNVLRFMHSRRAIILFDLGSSISWEAPTERQLIGVLPRDSRPGFLMLW